MTEIISFNAAASRLNKPAQVPRPIVGPAQLLFFTGVRYERPQVVIQAERKPRKRKAASVTSDAATGS